MHITLRIVATVGLVLAIGAAFTGPASASSRSCSWHISGVNKKVVAKNMTCDKASEIASFSIGFEVGSDPSSTARLFTGVEGFRCSYKQRGHLRYHQACVRGAKAVTAEIGFVPSKPRYAQECDY